MRIRDATYTDIDRLTHLVRTAFRDVAEQFQLTLENCPKHPSNCEPDWIQTALEKGVQYFILEDNQTPCGCVALEQAKPEVCYLERLAVIPQYRNQGFGRALVEHVANEAKKRGIRRVEIGIIAEHTDLKEWYNRLGFVVTGEKEFEHLPFRVTFMAKEI
jgi:N-acetylglutamate synthase-like GNAT family acetyltransferase